MDARIDSVAQTAVMTLRASFDNSQLNLSGSRAGLIQ